jgi:hypothetical protein
MGFYLRRLVSVFTVLSIPQASEDDVIPLKTPIKTKTGELVSHVTVAKGDTILVPIRTIHCMDTYWGEDALEFRPERWFEEDGHVKAKDFQGYRHLLTFIDGPRICIGKGFAVMEFKVRHCPLWPPGVNTRVLGGFICPHS